MSEIIKTEAVVLSKLEYSESSLIVSLFTQSNGLISAILKGGRKANSKLSKVVDVLNHNHIILYKKQSREIQVISSSEIISYFPKIKSNLDTAKYAFSICELIKKSLNEDEPNNLLFKGLIRILNLMENGTENSAVLFCRFFLFLIKQLGYEINLESCQSCHTKLKPDNKFKSVSTEGFLCGKCSNSNLLENNSELFKFLFCLKNKENLDSFSEKIINEGINYLINYLRTHVQSFNGLNSLRIFNKFNGGY